MIIKKGREADYGFDEAAAAIKAAGFTSVQVLTGNGFETQEL